jgi:hypothetical protein
MLTNKRQRKWKQFSVEACSVRNTVESMRAGGFGWEDVCHVFEKRYVGVNKPALRKMALDWKPSSPKPKPATPRCLEPSKVSNVESASTINSSLHRP